MVLTSSLEVGQGFGILKQNWYLEKGWIVELLEWGRIYYARNSGGYKMLKKNSLSS
jgi:hypothetical protein